MVLGKLTGSDNVGHGMLSSPFVSTKDQTTSGITHGGMTSGVAITSSRLGKHTRLDDIGVAGHHRPWIAYAGSDNVGRGMQ